MSESFQFNPHLPFARENYPGNKAVDGRFVNEDGIGPVGYRKLIQWLLSKNAQRAEKKAERFRLKEMHDERIFSSREDAFAWLGHAAFLIRLNGKLLLTDPCLFSLPGTKRSVPSPYAIEKLATADYVLFTHTHRDHFDEKSVRLLLRANPDLKFLVPLRMTPLLKKLGARHITEAGWYQEYVELQSSGIRLIFLPAKHWNRRFLHDTNRELWGSFLLQTENRAVYFAGDTAPATHFADVAKFFPGIDYAFMPVGAYKPHYVMKDAHMSPDEAVEAFHQLRAKTFVPMHYGTFDLADEPMGEPMRILRKHEAKQTLQGTLLEPAVGETIFFQ